MRWKCVRFCWFADLGALRLSSFLLTKELRVSFEMTAPVVNRLRPKLLLQLHPAATGLEAVASHLHTSHWEVWTAGVLEWKATL